MVDVYAVDLGIGLVGGNQFAYFKSLDNAVKLVDEMETFFDTKLKLKTIRVTDKQYSELPFEDDIIDRYF